MRVTNITNNFVLAQAAIDVQQQIVVQIPFGPIQNHDNKKQAGIYSTKLKDIVQGRQSSIISGLNKCKILTGTNASNGSRTRGYISLFCSRSLVGMYLCSFFRPTTQDDQTRTDTHSVWEGLCSHPLRRVSSSEMLGALCW